MNSNNYNSLIKLASSAPQIANKALPPEIDPSKMMMHPQDFKYVNLAARGTTPSASGATMQAPTSSKPKTYPAVNPATGGTRIFYKGGPIGLVEADSNARQGSLPLTPYSSGKINIDSMLDARRLALQVDLSRRLNESKKLEVALNFDAMFKNLHLTNQQRRAAGLPDYTPSALDVYAPHARYKSDYADAENRIYNDFALSAAAQEAARRGTPMNDAELRMLAVAAPDSDAERETTRNNPAFKNYMGTRLPLHITPDEMGRIANGIKR